MPLLYPLHLFYAMLKRLRSFCQASVCPESPLRGLRRMLRALVPSSPVGGFVVVPRCRF